MACFLCNKNDVVEKENPEMDYYFYDCPNCGQYGISEDIYDMRLVPKKMDENNFKEFINKATCIAAERNIKGMDRFFLVTDSEEKALEGNNIGVHYPIGITNFLKEYPKDAVEMFDRILLNLGNLIKHPADSYSVSTLVDSYNAIFYSANEKQAKSMIEELENFGWIKTSPIGNIELFIDIKITTKGWRHLAELREARAFEHSDKVFLAMWFDESTNQLRDAVKEAVKQAGYSPEEIVVNEADHNDYIMNKVINMISDAKFIIADFTCAPEKDTAGKISDGIRGGVYFEAGFARGQGKEVIHTCKDSDEAKSRLHFDVHQINTIFWEEEGGILKSYDKDFIDLLKNRIIATVGKGKHYQ